MVFCTYCGRAFNRNEHLQRHILTRKPKIRADMLSNKPAAVCLRCPVHQIPKYDRSSASSATSLSRAGKFYLLSYSQLVRTSILIYSQGSCAKAL